MSDTTAARLANDEKARALVKAALERRKASTNQTWLQIAKELEVDEVTIHRWREGEMARTSRVLVRLVVEECGKGTV